MHVEPATLGLIAALAVLLGLLLAARFRSAPRLERLAWALLPLATVATALVAWAAFRLVPHWTWSAARLAASARLAYGIPLYPAPDDAMVTGWVYGPVSALAYLPAVWAGEPLAALRAATWLNSFYFLLPPALLTLGLWRAPATRLPAAFAMLFATAALLAPYGLWYGAAALNADTVAFCLGALSCLALAREKLRPVAALLCVLATWTKQIEAPLALAQIGFLAWRCSPRAAGHYALWLAAAAVATTAVFVGWFGFAGLWHGLVTIPSRHPIEHARIGDLLLAFVRATGWVWVLALFLRPWRPAATPSLPAAHRETALLFLLASIATLPGGIAAAAKAGGGENSLHPIAYAVYAGITFGVGLLSADSPRVAARTLGALLAGLAVLLGLNLTRLVTHDHLALANPGTQHREAYTFARARPGQTYYPCNPLIALMAERRDYPFDYGLYDWRLAGAAPDPARLRPLLPDTLTFIIYHEKDPSHEMLRVFPEFSRRHEAGPWDLHLRPAPAGVKPGPNVSP
jgi:hypothetical protein